MIESPGNMNEDQLQEASRIAGLITAYVQKTLDRAGHDELDTWLSADRKNTLLFEELTDERNRDEAMQWMKDVQTRDALMKARQKIGFAGKPKTNFHIWQYAVAAFLLIAIALVAERMYTRSKHGGDDVTNALTNNETILPGGNKATLTLDDGTEMVLTEMRKGVLKNEQGVLIDKKADGEIVYNPGIANGRTDQPAYNTLTTPRGGEYMLTLSDGSKVWLNASSSIRYPVAMNDTIRKVYVTGEAYFEVARDPARPFVAVFNEINVVKVLGTHFNIMSYPDEEVIKATLAEGSVKVNGSTMLKPGEQYNLNKANSKEQVITNVDLEKELAWKNGFFNFSNAPIQTIMRQLARWYDVDVSYEGTINNSDFTATVSRTDNIAIILTRLEKTGAIHFKIEGKKITVIK